MGLVAKGIRVLSSKFHCQRLEKTLKVLDKVSAIKCLGPVSDQLRPLSLSELMLNDSGSALRISDLVSVSPVKVSDHPWMIYYQNIQSLVKVKYKVYVDLYSALY